MKVLITFEEDARASIAEATADCIWVIESAANRAAAQARWTTSGYQRNELTIFKPQTFAFLLTTVLDHHPSCESLEVRGLRDESQATEELWRVQFVPARGQGGSLHASRRRD